MKRTLDKIMEHKNLLLFAGGAAAAIVGREILKSKTTKELCVKTAAKIMKMQDEAEEAFQNVKEDAEDIRHDAKKKTKREIYADEIDEKVQKT